MSLTRRLLVGVAVILFIVVNEVVAVRDKFKQPFASNSIWNLPIGSGATFRASGLGKPGKAGLFIDEDVIVTQPTAKVQKIYYCSAGWNVGADRCKPDKGGKIIDNLPMPKNWIVYEAPPSTPNYGLAAVLPDGNTLHQNQPITKCSKKGKWTSMSDYFPVEYLDAMGQYGAHGGSKLSAMGGAIRLGELSGGGQIRHALKMNLAAAIYYWRGDVNTCYRWPAGNCDGYFNDPTKAPPQNLYNGKTYGLGPGTLLAIPPTVNLAALGLESAPGRSIAWTLQNYGAYLSDDSWRQPGDDPFVLVCEFGPNGRVYDELKSVFGANVYDAGSGLSNDLIKIMPQLQIVDSWNLDIYNRVANSGGGEGAGGGAPLQPWIEPPSGGSSSPDKKKKKKGKKGKKGGKKGSKKNKGKGGKKGGKKGGGKKGKGKGKRDYMEPLEIRDFKELRDIIEAEISPSIFVDSVGTDWQITSSADTYSVDSTTSFSGTSSVLLTTTAASAGLVFAPVAGTIDVSPYSYIHFAAKTNNADSVCYQIQAFQGEEAVGHAIPLNSLVTPNNNYWQEYNVPLKDLVYTWDVTHITISECTVYKRSDQSRETPAVNYGSNSDGTFVPAGSTEATEAPTAAPATSSSSDAASSGENQKREESYHQIWIDQVELVYDPVDRTDADLTVDTEYTAHTVFEDDDDKNNGWECVGIKGTTYIWESESVYRGTDALEYDADTAYGGIECSSPTAVTLTPYSHLSFAVMAGQYSSDMQVAVYSGDWNEDVVQVQLDDTYGGAPNSDGFHYYQIPLADFNLSSDATINRIAFVDTTGNADSVYFVDSIEIQNYHEEDESNTTLSTRDVIKGGPKPAALTMDALMTSINKYRASAKLAPLTPSTGLTRIAQAQAAYMSKRKLASLVPAIHGRPEVKKNYDPWFVLNEAVIKVAPTTRPGVVVATWDSKEASMQAMTNPYATDFGCAQVASNKIRYIACEFGAKKNGGPKYIADPISLNETAIADTPVENTNDGFAKPYNPNTVDPEFSVVNTDNVVDVNDDGGKECMRHVCTNDNTASFNKRTCLLIDTCGQDVCQPSITCEAKNQTCGILWTGCGAVSCGDCDDDSVCEKSKGKEISYTCVAKGCSAGCPNNAQCVKGECQCPNGAALSSDKTECAVDAKTYPFDEVESYDVSAGTWSLNYVPDTADFNTKLGSKGEVSFIGKKPTVPQRDVPEGVQQTDKAVNGFAMWKGADNVKKGQVMVYTATVRTLVGGSSASIIFSATDAKNYAYLKVTNAGKLVHGVVLDGQVSEESIGSLYADNVRKNPPKKRRYFCVTKSQVKRLGHFTSCFTWRFI